MRETVCSFLGAYGKGSSAFPAAAAALAGVRVGDSLTVERAALTRLVLVRIQVPQPFFRAAAAVRSPGVAKQALDHLFAGHDPAEGRADATERGGVQFRPVHGIDAVLDHDRGVVAHIGGGHGGEDTVTRCAGAC